MDTKKLFLAAFFCLTGCHAVYPGDGQLVIVDYDRSFDQLVLHVEDGTTTTFGEQLRQGIRYWDRPGARLRTTEQLLPSEQDEAKAAPVLKINRDDSDLSKIGLTYNGYQSEATGEITLYTYWLPSVLYFDDVCAVQDSAAHETGHSMGLSHIGDPWGIMNAHTPHVCGLTDSDVDEFCHHWPSNPQCKVK